MIPKTTKQFVNYETLVTVLNSVDALVYVVDMQTYEVLYMNQAAVQVWGNLVGNVCWKMMGEKGPCSDCVNKKLLTGDYTDVSTTREFNGPGSRKWYSVRDQVIQWMDGRRVRLGVAADIGEYKAIEEALRESEERYRKLVELSPAAILVVSEGIIDTANQQALRLMGNIPSEEIIGSTMERFLDPRCFEELRQLVEESLRNNIPKECELVRKDGTAVPVELSAVSLSNGTAKSVRITLWDLTEQKRREEEYIKATRLESIGLLAGGIAHDFNNILTIISGYLSIASIYAQNKGYAQGSKGQLQQTLAEIDKAVNQAVGLTQQLLTFAKGGEPVKTKISLEKTVMETVQFALSGSNVRWSVQANGYLPCVEVDEGQFSQVISNLSINAGQAMPAGGTFTVTLETHSLTEENPFQLCAGTYVVITATDEGCGIHEDNLPKIFDPYFTTKSDGSGLGLATCYSIIKKHGGHITVASQYGRGTTFTLYIPAALGEVDPEPVKTPTHSNKGKILVMDDDRIIRELLLEMLTYLGYHADSCANGEEAIALYAQAFLGAEPYDAIMLDLMVRDGLGGRETMEKIKLLNPEVLAIVSSGYSNDDVLADHTKYGFSTVIAKPYRLDDLAVTLHNLLEKNR
jgi:two-component system, cell cycle sensor histidine kinase and response regulator CckA